jgi:penicillin-binding protein 1A
MVAAVKNRMRGLAARFVRSFAIVALFLGAAILGTASGVLFAFVGDLPLISALDDYSPSTITRVLGRDGSVVAEFATERRVILTYDQIPPVLRQAIVATEDDSFFSHSGVDLGRIAVTAVKRVLRLQRYGGASTLTQQLARKLFLTDEQTPERKIKEAILSIQIEKRYTKEEIFTMYCNKVYWGHGAYGVEAASRLYFAKSANDLTLDEAAMIAGIIQGNVRQSPYVNPQAALRRRNTALEQMADEGYITVAEMEAAKKRPIVTHGEPAQAPSIAPYFKETVRRYLEERYGAKAVYENGLTVKTGLDPMLQGAANQALDDHLRKLDKARGYRKPARNILSETRSLDTYRHPRWTSDPGIGEVVPGLVLGIDDGVIRVRVHRWTGRIERPDYAWTKRKAADAVTPGDLIDVRILTVDGKGGFKGALDQAPLLQGAAVAIDNKTGQVLAMVGGSGFDTSQFNRSTQAMRQVGSLFKPFVFTAAIDRGYTATSILDDSPASFPQGPNQPPYEPQNYDREFEGDVTLRRALEQSRNIPTIRLMAALDPKTVVTYARRMGVSSPLPPYLSVAIGSAEATLLEMTSAYSAFPNQGVRMTPQVVLEVTDREGNMLEHQRGAPNDALRADTAYILTTLLRGVVQRGTGASANALNWPLGGKTGTTDDYTDAWFIGFDPDITLGVWIGFDLKKPIGNRITGTTGALPMWIQIMKPWVERRRKELAEPPDFPRPNNVVIVMTENGPEAYIVGTEPAGK